MPLFRKGKPRADRGQVRLATDQDARPCRGFFAFAEGIRAAEDGREPRAAELVLRVRLFLRLANDCILRRARRLRFVLRSS